MSRSSRLIAVLQLFESSRAVWTADAVSRALKISASTAYRLVRDLVKAGFLDPVTGAGYALGPAFIRYDRILRQSDRLISIADPVMQDLLGRTSQSADVILCRRFKDCVMCVHEVHGTRPHPPTSYERGVAMPMFLGATSKVILAHLPDRTLKATYLANEKAIRRSRQAPDWPTFKAQLKEIRRAGFALTDSEVATGRIGLAAPVARGGQVIASVSLVVVASGSGKRKLASFVPHVLATAERISRLLSREVPVISR
jgi:DNA-binding IclR family transcriptional regulator